MESVFTNLDNQEVEATTEVETKEAPKSGRKEKIAAMREAIKTTIAEDPTFVEKVRSLTEDLEVVHTLGFGDSGNIVVDRTKEERTLKPTSAIVGYKLRNNGDEPVKYITETHAQDESGKFVGTKTEKFIEPGGEADLTRQYMTMLCAAPEISFQLSNGKIIRGAGAKGETSLKDELEAYYFAFNKEEDGTKLQVNDDEVKLNIAEKVDGEWKVKAEYIEAFGFLNNPKETTGGRRKSTKSKYNAQDMAANYINRLIQTQEV